ncbi:MAG: hypothetical protein JJ902_00580 [Roseibium sp.]|nr:hypothetical protein [Roseibium sp.]
MSLQKKTRQAAEEEALRIKRVAEKSSTGGQLGGTRFGQEPFDAKTAEPATRRPGSDK